jgi:hypothetical protein
MKRNDRRKIRRKKKEERRKKKEGATKVKDSTFVDEPSFAQNSES